MTIALHSISVQAIFIANCCNWAREYSNFLLNLEKDLRLEFANQRSWPEPEDLKDSILFFKSMLRGQTNNFNTFKDRANLQVNLLYSIINQQDSIQNRWDSRLTQLIAKSTKQDSTSMTTFTFITALFLPGTFIATLFSMTMFDWQPSDSQPYPQGESSDRGNVSNNFWIFWVITIPLTLFTMLGWYLWFRHANGKWSEELRTGLNLQETGSPILPQSVAQISLPLEKVYQLYQPLVYPNSMDPQSNIAFEDTRIKCLIQPEALKGASNYQFNSFARWYETGEGTNIFALPERRTNPQDPFHLYGWTFPECQKRYSLGASR